MIRKVRLVLIRKREITYLQGSNIVVLNSNKYFCSLRIRKISRIRSILIALLSIDW